ncbi:hypothetical protein AAE478_003057 [Parahypoxylon ruwenzoriense]
MWNPLHGLRLLLDSREDITKPILTSPQDSVNGSFVFPRTWPTNVRETSIINISWVTKYEGVNLYYYQRGKIAASIRLATDLATDWYQWVVRMEETDFTEPFVFHIINARGTIDETFIGGFWSTSFIIRDEPPHTASPSTSSAAPFRPWETLAVTPSSDASLPTQTKQASQDDNRGLSSGTAAGVSVANVLGVVGLAVACTWYFRKRKVHHDNARPVRPPKSPLHPLPPHMESQPPYQRCSSPLELNTARAVYELPTNDRQFCTYG